MGVETEMKKGGAKDLYKAGYNIDKISQLLGVSRKTIGLWSQTWKQQLNIQYVTDNDVDEIIQYQAMAIRKKTQQYREEGEKTGEYKLLERGDIDAFQKLTVTRKGEKKDFATYTKVIKELTEFATKEDLRQAKDMLPMLDIFLITKQKELQ